MQFKKNTAYVFPNGDVYANDPNLERLVEMRFSRTGHPRPSTIRGATLRIEMAEDDPLMKSPQRRGR
jgi:hypothetical protein